MIPNEPTKVHSGEPTKADARDTNEPRPHLFSRGELLHLLLSALVQKHQRYWQKLPKAANKMTSILDTKRRGIFLGGCLTCAGKGSTFEFSVTSIWALPVRVGGSKPLPEWFGALF